MNIMKNSRSLDFARDDISRDDNRAALSVLLGMTFLEMMNAKISKH